MGYVTWFSFPGVKWKIPYFSSGVKALVERTFFIEMVMNSYWHHNKSENNISK